MTMSRPFRASRFSPIPQGVALGWYIPPLQGFHLLYHVPCQKRKIKRVE